jgi:hypothetical protein
MAARQLRPPGRHIEGLALRVATLALKFGYNDVAELFSMTQLRKDRKVY